MSGYTLSPESEEDIFEIWSYLASEASIYNAIEVSFIVVSFISFEEPARPQPVRQQPRPLGEGRILLREPCSVRSVPEDMDLRRHARTEHDEIRFGKGRRIVAAELQRDAARAVPPLPTHPAAGRTASAGPSPAPRPGRSSSALARGS